MKIQSSITWPNGKQTRRYINFSNIKERQNFAKFCLEALSKGAIVTTKKVIQHENVDCDLLAR